MKILIVDDSFTTRIYLSKMLKLLGHDVVQATDGLEAWYAFQREYYPVVITDWHEYRHPDFERIRRSLRGPVVIDARNLYSLERMRRSGLAYHSIGRESVG